MAPESSNEMQASALADALATVNEIVRRKPAWAPGRSTASWATRAWRSSSSYAVKVNPNLAGPAQLIPLLEQKPMEEDRGRT